MLFALTAACIATAAASYQLPTSALYAILAAERGQIGHAVPNKNGTSDLGPFQINTSWAKAFAQFWSLSGRDAAILELRDNGCANAIAASAILAGYMAEAHGDLPTALGYYHSHRADLATAYRTKVLTIASRLQAGARP